VKYCEHAQPNQLTTTSSALTRPGFRVVGLASDTSYDFQVFAVNAGGAGDPGVITNQRTLAAPQGAPASDLRPSNVTNCEIGLVWPPVANAEGYMVQYRIHDSDHDWTEVKFKQDKAVIKGLRANTLYDLRIAALFPTQATLGPWTTIKVATTGPRIPQWSDAAP
jgi:hypothetical protein